MKKNLFLLIVGVIIIKALITMNTDNNYTYTPRSASVSTRPYVSSLRTPHVFPVIARDLDSTKLYAARLAALTPIVKLPPKLNISKRLVTLPCMSDSTHKGFLRMQSLRNLEKRDSIILHTMPKTDEQYKEPEYNNQVVKESVDNEPMMDAEENELEHIDTIM